MMFLFVVLFVDVPHLYKQFPGIVIDEFIQTVALQDEHGLCHQFAGMEPTQIQSLRELHPTRAAEKISFPTAGGQLIICGLVWHMTHEILSTLHGNYYTTHNLIIYTRDWTACLLSC